MVRGILESDHTWFIAVSGRSSGNYRFCWQDEGLQMRKLLASRVASRLRKFGSKLSCPNIAALDSRATTEKEDVIRRSSLTRGL